MRLFIAEKPSLARAIADGLGSSRREASHLVVGSDIVTWCFGHILELANPDEYKPEWQRWRAEHLPIRIDEWKLKPQKSSADQLKAIGGFLKKATEVVNAGDPDREGQLLVDEVLHYFGWRGKTTRILLNATDPGSVKKALARIEDNAKYQPLYEAALCRQRADWLVGINLTRGATKILADDATVSVGRVQTPTLALVVRRDREIESFVPSSFYYLEAEVKAPGGEVVLTHNPQDPRLTDSKVANQLAADVKGKTYPLSVAKKTAKEMAPLPFMLATFQKAAEAALGLGATQSLKALQQLYEQQLVSYPRTDCPYLPGEQAADAAAIAADVVDALGDAEAKRLIGLMQPKKRIYDSAKVTEHHGLVPTRKMPSASLEHGLRQAWELVSRQFLMSLLPDYEYEETEISFDHQGKVFSTKIQVPLNMAKSWRALDPKSAGAPPPAIKDGDPGRVADVAVKSGKTTPPKRYTEATLIADMRSIAKFVSDPRLKAVLKETSGIGTAATQATTIDKLKDQEYIEARKKELVSTTFGRNVIDALPVQICDPGTTAVWEDALGRIAKGDYAMAEFMRRIDLFVENRLTEMRSSGKRIPKPEGSAASSRGAGSKPASGGKPRAGGKATPRKAARSPARRK